MKDTSFLGPDSFFPFLNEFFLILKIFQLSIIIFFSEEVLVWFFLIIKSLATDKMGHGL